ncbi:WGxxGxxG family protein [Amycolatopsis nivea]
MTAHVRRQVCALVVAAAIPLAGAASADAAVVAPGTAQNTADDDHDNGNDGLWGLLGLFGLLGLAGLVRRGPKSGAMAGYPPANAYPPAGPRREPPGA